MRVLKLLKQIAIFFTAVCTSALSATAQQPQNQNPDVIRVTTSLVQTDVMVFDKQGKFVDNLKREQFVLKVDGKPREISFFELVKAGSANEETQLAAARGAPSRTGGAVPLDRGRMVFFFIDDLHLSASSLHYVRSVLSRFIDREAGQNDKVAIVSATGQIGFLQQLTDNKTVLRKAVARLSPGQQAARDIGNPRISEYQAQLIDQQDQGVISYFVDAVMREGVSRQVAEQLVRQRASMVLEQSARSSMRSLASLRYVLQTAADLPGRKLVFFVSDGFFVNTRDEVRQRVHDLTTQAARSGVVIYSVDARGLVPSMSDPTEAVDLDPTRLQRSTSGELTASQDGMHALAVDTGGRALFNTNDLSKSVRTGLAETSQYYLLAWTAGSDKEKSTRDRRLVVAIAERPELIVRLRRNFADVESSNIAANEPAKVTTLAQAIREPLRAQSSKTSLPVHVTANFLNLANRGPLLFASVKVATGTIPLEIANGSATAQIDLLLAIFDDKGTSVQTFNRTLTLRSKTADTTPAESILFHAHLPIKPGLYQVRAALLARNARRIGSATHWIEIPNVEPKTLTLSSLIVAEKRSSTTSLDASAGDSQPADGNPLKDLRLSIERRFSRDSQLRFLILIYNAATASAQSSGAELPSASPKAVAPPAVPDLAVQVQVFRDDQPVITSPTRKIDIEGVQDLSRVPYGANIPLEGLQSGSYELRVVVIDRIAKTTAAENFKFQVD
jgi:VWFA-related protein